MFEGRHRSGDDRVTGQSDVEPTARARTRDRGHRRGWVVLEQVHHRSPDARVFDAASGVERGNLAKIGPREEDRRVIRTQNQRPRTGPSRRLAERGCEGQESADGQNRVADDDLIGVLDR
jgi:hypothetical protein